MTGSAVALEVYGKHYNRNVSDKLYAQRRSIKSLHVDRSGQPCNERTPIFSNSQKHTPKEYITKQKNCPMSDPNAEMTFWARESESLAFRAVRSSLTRESFGGAEETTKGLLSRAVTSSPVDTATLHGAAG